MAELCFKLPLPFSWNIKSRPPPPPPPTSCHKTTVVKTGGGKDDGTRRRRRAKFTDGLKGRRNLCGQRRRAAPSATLSPQATGRLGKQTLNGEGKTKSIFCSGKWASSSSQEPPGFLRLVRSEAAAQLWHYIPCEVGGLRLQRFSFLFQSQRQYNLFGTKSR